MPEIPPIIFETKPDGVRPVMVIQITDFEEMGEQVLAEKRFDFALIVETDQLHTLYETSADTVGSRLHNWRSAGAGHRHQGSVRLCPQRDDRRNVAQRTVQIPRKIR